MNKHSPLIHFQAKEYSLIHSESTGLTELVITGERLGKPSKRLTLSQTGLKIKDAAIHAKNKNKAVDYEVSRINNLPTQHEVRLHTANLMYPGEYRLTLTYSGKSIDEIKKYLESDRSEPMSNYWPSFAAAEEGFQVKVS